MLKKLMVLVAALMMGFVLVASPAAADIDGDHSAKNCIKYDGDKTTCLQVGWSKQADGTGVRLENMWVTTPRGCPIVVGSGYYDHVEADFFKPSTGQIDYHYNFGDEPACQFVKDVSNAGTDGGAMMLNFYLRQNDNQLTWQIKMWPGGDFDWTRSEHHTV